MWCVGGRRWPMTEKTAAGCYLSCPQPAQPGAASPGAPHATLAPRPPPAHHAHSTICAGSVELIGGLLAFVK